MMRWFRRYRTQLLAGLVVLLMLSWGVGGFLARSTSRPEEIFGRIHGKAVTRVDMAGAATTLRLGALLGFLDQRALMGLQMVEGSASAKKAGATLATDFLKFVLGDADRIGDDAAWRCLVLMREAEAQGIAASRAEVDELLRVAPLLAADRRFSTTRYGQFLRAYELTPGDVVNGLTRLTRVARLLSLRREAVLTNRAEAWMRYCHDMEQVRLRFVAVDAALFLPLVEFDPADLEQWYADHLDRVADPDAGVVGYMAPTRVKVECAVAPVERLTGEVTVGDEEVAAYYEQHKVLFRKPEPEEASGAEEAEAQDGADEEPEYKALAEVRDEIAQTLKSRKAMEKGRELVDAVRADMDAVGSDYVNEPMPLAQMARRHGLDYRVLSVAEGRQFLSREELAAVAPNGNEVAAFAFDEADNLYDPQTFGRDEQAAVCQVLARREPAPQPYEEVKEQVRRDYGLNAALESAQAFAQKLREGAAAKGLEGAVAEMDGPLKALTGAAPEDGGPLLQTRESEAFRRSSLRAGGVPGGGPELVAVAFGLAPDEVGLAVEGPPVSQCYVFEVIERRSAAAEQFGEQGPMYRLLHLYEKQGQAVQDWLARLVDGAERFERVEK